jgi:hypothetical protein
MSTFTYSSICDGGILTYACKFLINGAGSRAQCMHKALGSILSTTKNKMKIPSTHTQKKTLTRALFAIEWKPPKSSTGNAYITMAPEMELPPIQ